MIIDVTGIVLTRGTAEKTAWETARILMKTGMALSGVVTSAIMRYAVMSRHYLRFAVNGVTTVTARVHRNV